MADVTVTKTNEVYLKVDCEPSIAQEISDFFTFDVPGAKFTPQYRSRLWDGRIRLYHLFTRELYVGLLPYLKEYCNKAEYTFEEDIPRIGEKVSLEDLQKFAKVLRLHAAGKEIDARDYQLEAVQEALQSGRTLLLSPTASGKSLIIYLLIRWHQMRDRRQLVIVPTTSLVEQMYGDFADYAALVDWSAEKNVATIYSGKEKVNDFPVVISTWQSIYKMPKSWFAQFQVIYGDECHQFKAKSLTGIMHKCVASPYRIGTTGTLDGTKTHKLVLEGLFGAVKKVTTTKELMNTKQLAELNIKCIVLGYSDNERKAAKKLTYQEEIDFLVTHPLRNKFIRNLVLDCKGNTLVLFQFVEKHGQVLYEMIQKKAAEGRKVFFVHGGVDTADREEVRRITETETDAIIVASSGTFSTGINIRNLHNIVFASPSKSRIRNLQSIGRGLRKSDVKDKCKLFDIGDDLVWKAKMNYTLKHMMERIKIYAEEGFLYKVISVPLGA
jgi:superfamily II DNA or RNA helicase